MCHPRRSPYVAGLEGLLICLSCGIGITRQRWLDQHETHRNGKRHVPPSGGPFAKGSNLGLLEKQEVTGWHRKQRHNCFSNSPPQQPKNRKLHMPDFEPRCSACQPRRQGNCPSPICLGG